MFRYNGTEKLRCGYTTGTCAAAAAGAAAVYLLTGKAPSEISVRLPGGDVLRLPVSEPFADEHSADCGIVKDSSSGRFFSISKEDKHRIADIFAEYGGVVRW